uniref:Probable peptidoglycan glycosyltransferase FtsW n=1 Tax=Cyanothece sp. (strain PCC 7425 / ATCC 29141) TaxID=395961 RepID=B8HP34_CYAP4
MPLILRRLIPFFDPTVPTWSIEARLLRWLTFLWLVLGLVVLFSASYHTGLVENNDGLFYFKRQLIWIAMGLVGFHLFVHLPLKRSLYLATPAFFACLGLVFATHLPGVGTTTMGATRWINILGFQLQPSELLKPFLVLQSAWVFGNWYRLAIKARLTWLAIFGVMLLGILKQPNLSTTALCGITLWLMALAAELPYSQLLLAVLGGIGTATASIMVNEYQRLRVSSFINPWKDPMDTGYQLIQSLLAVGSGGVWGLGYGMSQQKLSYLPIQHTDFIFSIYAEEFGLIGGILLLALLTIYGAIALRVALKTTEPVYRLVGVGAMAIMLVQALINIGVAIGALPTTGLPFPLLSYGGSSMIASLCIAGLLIRVAREGTQGDLVPINTPGEVKINLSAPTTGQPSGTKALPRSPQPSPRRSKRPPRPQPRPR